MYYFLDKLFNIALPRVRDFRGLPDKAFDGRGNYTLGIKEQIIFPEINYDKIDKIKGLEALINLQELYLDGNNIMKLEGFDNLQNLIMLHLGRNSISSFRNESIESLKNLNFLFLNENPLDQMSWNQFKKRFKFP